MGYGSHNQNGGGMVRHLPRHVARGGEKRATESRFATLNVRGGINGKIDEVCQMMDERRIDVLCVNETKRKGCDTTEHETYTAYWSGVPSTSRGCQGVSVILSDRMNECVREVVRVSPRLIWVRLKVGLTRIFVLGAYAPTDMGSRKSPKAQKEMDEFWEGVRETLKKCEQNERIIMLGDFNGWVGIKRDGYEGVLGKFGDERVNENGKSLLEICLEWNLCVANTLFAHKKIHIYTREEGEARSMIDFVIVDERLRKKVLDARAYRGVGVDSDHHLVLSRIDGLFKQWRHRPQEQTSVLERIKVERLQEKDVRDEYMKSLRERFRNLDEMNDLECLWNEFKDGVVDMAVNVCGVSKRRKGNKKKKNVWVDKSVQAAVCEKKKAWLDWLATKANQRIQKATKDDVEEARKEYKRVKKKVKDVVKRKKDEVKDEFDRRLSDDFQANKKFFWKSIRSTRGKVGAAELGKIRGQDGSIIKGEECKLKRWKGYFESLFEKDEAEVSMSSAKINKSRDNESEISMDEIVKALNRMKLGKAAGYDRVSVEMLKAGRGITASLLYRLFNLCWTTGQVPGDWCKAVIVPLYKGKGSQQDCKNYRGISLLSVVGKLYAKVLIERVMKYTDGKMWDVQAGFRKGMGCTDQVFSLRCIAEKFLAKNQKVYCAFVDLEKAYDRVVRNELWSALSTYGVSSHLIQALKSLYRDSSACVRINGAYTDWFCIEKGVRQGCVASPWLFNLFMDNCLTNLKESMCGLKMNELLVKCLLYADDQVLLAPSADELQEMVTVMNAALERKGMKVNASKTKVMVFEREDCMTACNILIGDEQLEQVKEFVYLGSKFTRDGKCDDDIERRVNAGNMVNGALHSFMTSQRVSKKARLAVHRGVLVPTLSFGSESWVWQKKHESRINAVEMRALRSMIGVKVSDRIRNSVIRERCGVKEDVVTKIEKGMLRWFGHVERMDESRLTKEIYKAEVEGNVGRGRPRRTYLNQIQDVLNKGQVKSTLNRRACMKGLMKVEEAREVCKDRSKWKDVVSAYPSGRQA